VVEQLIAEYGVLFNWQIYLLSNSHSI